jgi:hypothetical protein
MIPTPTLDLGSCSFALRHPLGYHFLPGMTIM